MKTIRLFGMALLTVLMGVSFSACGGSDDDDNDGGSSSTSIEGTWYLKSVKGFYYFPADGMFDPHNSNKNPDVEYDDYSHNVVVTFTKQGENIIANSKVLESNSSKTLLLEKMGTNEYRYIADGSADRIIIKTVTSKQLVMEWYDEYYKDINGTIADKDHFYVARYSFMR